MTCPYLNDAPLTWVNDALEVIRTFPATAKARLIGELVHLHRAGANSQWTPLRGVPGALLFATRHEIRKGVPQKAFRVACTISFLPEVIVLQAFEREERRGDEPVPEKHVSAVRARLTKLQLDREERQSRRIELGQSANNPFVDVGFSSAEGRDFLERAILMSDLRLLQRRSAPSQLCNSVRDILRRDIDAVGVENLRAALQTARATVRT